MAQILGVSRIVGARRSDVRIKKDGGRFAVFGIGRAEPFYAHLSQPVIFKPQGLSGGMAEIDQAAVDIRAAIIDPHDNTFAGVQPCDAGATGQAHGPVCRREQRRVENLAIGGLTAFKPRTIPTGHASLYALWGVRLNGVGI